LRKAIIAAATAAHALVPPRASLCVGVSDRPVETRWLTTVQIRRWSPGLSGSPTSLVVNSAARISSDFSSIPIWILRQTLRFEPPCLRAFHSPSPST
jgi:hypothetical protein